jgi:GAF domain-containing protein
VVQLFDKDDGDFTELDEEVLMQLVQMASAAVERADLYRR